MARRTESPPSKASLRDWWKQFTTAQKFKKDFVEQKRGHAESRVFNVPLRESLGFASVQISTANTTGDLYVWGYIPVVVAKCGLHLKENATEVPGTFRVSGSTKRMRELQALFETSPRFGKTLDLKQGQFTSHDVASVFRRYLTSMPEPVIPHDLYHSFRDALSKRPFSQDECINTYKRLIRSMPRANQYLLLYVLDLLSVFARKSDKNLMTPTNLAVIFRPGLLSHPDHEMSPDHHRLSQDVLEFLIAHQDWFMLDIPPPPSGSTEISDDLHQEGLSRRNDADAESVATARSLDDDHNGWKLVERRGRQDRSPQGWHNKRRRPASASERSSNPSSPLSPVSDQTEIFSMGERAGAMVEGDMGESPASPTNVMRSRTLPARRVAVSASGGEETGRPRNVLRKGRGDRGRRVEEQGSRHEPLVEDDDR